MTRRCFYLEWSGGGARMRCAPAAYNMLYMLVHVVRGRNLAAMRLGASKRDLFTR